MNNDLLNTCPKCGYIRKTIDKHIPDTECPGCGIIFEKFYASKYNKENTEEKKLEEQERRRREVAKIFEQRAKNKVEIQMLEEPLELERPSSPICLSCNCKLQPDVHFCPKCGKKININKEENEEKNQYNAKINKQFALGCGSFLCLFVVLSVLMCSDNKTSNMLPVNEYSNWYSGGTLHRSTVEEWNNASYSDKLATAADWALNGSSKLRSKINNSDNIEILKPYAT